MSIEEERKAFKQHTGLDSNSYNHEFGFWLKAKAHAAEIAKPTSGVTETREEAVARLFGHFGDGQ